MAQLAQKETPASSQELDVELGKLSETPQKRRSPFIPAAAREQDARRNNGDAVFDENLITASYEVGGDIYDDQVIYKDAPKPWAIDEFVHLFTVKRGSAANF
jgi:hypothetical protein